jgi:hypothetical protein
MLFADSCLQVKWIEITEYRRWKAEKENSREGKQQRKTTSEKRRAEERRMKEAKINSIERQ